MHMFGRILLGARPYWLLLSAAVICAMVYALLSSATIWMMVPFLQSIFETPQPAQVQQGQPAGVGIEKSVQVGFWQGLKTDLRMHTDRWISGGSREATLRRICVIIVVVFFLKSLFGYAQSYLMVRAEQGIIKRFRDRLYEHLQALSLSYFHRHQTGHLISRVVNDVALLNEAVNVALVNLVREPLMVVVYVGLMLILSWKLTLAIVIALPLGARLFSLIGTKLRKYSLRSQERIADITSLLEETVSGIRVVKTFAMEQISKSALDSQHSFNIYKQPQKDRHACCYLIQINPNVLETNTTKAITRNNSPAITKRSIHLNPFSLEFIVPMFLFIVSDQLEALFVMIKLSDCF